MELQANCKINLGLRVVRRRADGFHDIETVMLPVRGLYDTVFVAALATPETYVMSTPTPYPSPEPVFVTQSVLETSGGELDCPPEQNICMRALRLMQDEFGIGEAHIKLHKAIPTGAGLGGGSSDAAAVLKALNDEFVLELSDGELETLAARLGSDVPFFIKDTPRLCTGRGEVLSLLADRSLAENLSGKWLVITKPDITVSTAEAYSSVVPREAVFADRYPDAGLSLPEILRRDIGEWRELLVNDFEPSVFARHPRIGHIKTALYEAGALYASMSGSGSAVYGIFDERPNISSERFDAVEAGFFVHIEQFKP